MAMKQRVKKTMAAGLGALLFFWYFSPAMAALRAMPQAVDPGTAAAVGPLIEARPVRSSGDERLPGEERTYALLGLVPLRTVQTAPSLPTVRLGGQAVGVVLYTKGVQVVGLTAVETAEGALSPASAAGLKKGDAILAVDGQPVSGVAGLSKLLQDRIQAELTVQRGGERLTLSLHTALERDTGARKLGAWVRESTSGIGTLSFLKGDRFCALGHGVADVDTGLTLLTERGYITPAAVTAALKAEAGRVGELAGEFSTRESDAVGIVDVNGDYGVAGPYLGDGSLWGTEVPLAAAAQVQTGDATLYSAADGAWRGYDCRIIRLKVQSAPGVQGMMIEVTDRDLLSLTGGIVPGMSGSPVVQNGRLVGVVTHVFVNEPKRGYCVYAQWMLEKLF
jgi:stage IV sporulation protein B